MLVPSYANVLAALLLFWSGAHVKAQSGYNYVRPELAQATAAGAAGARLAGGAALLPGSYPTAAGLPLTPSPATTAYGASLFPTQAVGFTPTGPATTAFAAPVANTAVNLPQQRRPTSPAATASRGGPFAQPQFNAVQGGRTSVTAGSTGSGGNDEDYNDGDFSAIPGVPGVDYPVYAQVPRTNFDCSQQPLPGYYADIEAQCQVFHICALNRTYSFLCPNGTVFSQETLVCVWWNQYDCVSAPSLYANNAYIYDYSSSSSSSSNSNTNVNSNINSNVNAYPLGSRTAPTAYGGAVATVPTATFRGTGVPQVAGYVGSNAARAYTTPSPTAVQPQTQFGAVIRPASITGNVASPNALRTGPTASGNIGLVSNTANTLPENAVGSFAQPVAGGNREYLPPASSTRRQRATLKQMSIP